MKESAAPFRARRMLSLPNGIRPLVWLRICWAVDAIRPRRPDTLASERSAAGDRTAAPIGPSPVILAVG